MRIKEYAKNQYLKARLWWYRQIGRKSEGMYWYPNEYFNLKRDFKIGMPWGTVHPQYSHQVMESSSVEIIDKGEGAILSIVPFNGTVISGGNTYTPKISAGCLYSKIPFRFGTFEIEYTLPESDESWPAFWLFGKDTWPPEIDMFEFMPNSHKRNHTRKLSISTHSSGAHGGHLNNSSGLIVDIEPRMTMTMVWTPESLRFFHNNLLIKEVTNKEALRQFATQDQWLIIGTGVMSDYTSLSLYDKFIVHNVKYRKYD